LSPKIIAKRAPNSNNIIKFGLPFNVEQVNQGRIIYDVESGTMHMLRCFSTHKDYEKRYQSFR